MSLSICCVIFVFFYLDFWYASYLFSPFFIEIMRYERCIIYFFIFFYPWAKSLDWKYFSAFIGINLHIYNILSYILSFLYFTIKIRWICYCYIIFSGGIHRKRPKRCEESILVLLFFIIFGEPHLLSCGSH